MTRVPDSEQAGVAADERDRAFRDLGLEHPFDDDHLHRICAYAARICGVSAAAVSLVQPERLLFVGRAGLDVADVGASSSFCGTAMFQRDMMIVPDAHADPRFRDLGLVTGPPFIRFYAGVPLVTEGGVPLGSLCVFDSAPREGLDSEPADVLQLLSQAVMDRLQLRRRDGLTRAALEHARRPPGSDEFPFRILTDAMPQMVWSADADGMPDYYNARWYEFTGTTPEDSYGDAWINNVHPDDRAMSTAAWTRSVMTGETYDIEYRLRRAEGTYRWALGRAFPMRDGQGRIVRWFGTCTDIDDQKRALAEREIISQELSHRIKNIFAVISGLIGLAARDRPAFSDTAQMLRDRVLALGRAHDFVRPHTPAPGDPTARIADLHGLLSQLVAPYEAHPGERVRISGADPAIDDRSATPLALLVHELSTNAAKYGALSVPEGWVEITVEELAGDQIQIRWVEHGGPRVTTHNPPGFGSRLLDLSLRKQLAGDFVQRWDDGKLDMTILIPLSSFSRTVALAKA